MGEHVSFANLGVAYMRNREFGLAHKALKKAIALNPADSHAVENLEARSSIKAEFFKHLFGSHAYLPLFAFICLFNDYLFTYINVT